MVLSEEFKKNDVIEWMNVYINGNTFCFGSYNFRKGGNQKGYGGASWTIKVKQNNGIIEERRVWGAWSSRSSVMNMYFKPHCIECRIEIINGHFGGDITIDKARETLKRFVPSATIIRDFHKDECAYLIVLKDGRKKPNQQPNQDIIKVLKEMGEYKENIIGSKRLLERIERKGGERYGE